MKYAVVINSDRVHISLDGAPVETRLFSIYADKHQDGKEVAIGLVVIKAMALNDTGIKKKGYNRIAQVTVYEKIES